MFFHISGAGLWKLVFGRREVSVLSVRGSDSTLRAALSLLLTSMGANAVFPCVPARLGQGVVECVVRGLRSTFPTGLWEDLLIC